MPIQPSCLFMYLFLFFLCDFLNDQISTNVINGHVTGKELIALKSIQSWPPWGILRRDDKITHKYVMIKMLFKVEERNVCL